MDSESTKNINNVKVNYASPRRKPGARSAVGADRPVLTGWTPAFVGLTKNLLNTRRWSSVSGLMCGTGRDVGNLPKEVADDEILGNSAGMSVGERKGKTLNTTISIII